MRASFTSAIALLVCSVGGVSDVHALTCGTVAPIPCNDGYCNGGLCCVRLYPDADGDGYGTGFGEEFCGSRPSDHARQPDDCDDRPGVGATVYPGAPEVCGDNIDQDCIHGDLSLNTCGQCTSEPDDLGESCSSGEGLCVATGVMRCNPDWEPVNTYPRPPKTICSSPNGDPAPLQPLPPQAEACDGLDNDCDGEIDESASSQPVNGPVTLSAGYYGGVGQAPTCDARDYTPSDTQRCQLPIAIDVTNGQAGIQWTDLVFDKPNGAGETRCRYRGLETQAHPGDYASEGESDYEFLFCDDGSSPGDEMFLSSARLEVGSYDVAESPLQLHVDLSCVDANCVYADDADGDGYFPSNSCFVGDGVDCDDADPDIFRCESECVDQDGDGFFVGCDQYIARPQDCWDDGGANSASCTTECTAPYDSCRLNVCGPNGDQPKRSFYPDADGDGWGDPRATPLIACDPPAGFVDRAGDCNDEPGENGAEQFPEATEFCDEVDNNCNGLIDEELGAEDYYVDADHDGYGGSENTRVRSCQDPGDGWSLTYGDCNDSDKSVWSNCDGNDPGPLVGALAPESLPDGKWRVGVRFFDRFGVDWENATLQVAGAGGDGSLAHAPEFLTTVVDAPDGATITLSGQVSSVQAAVRSYSFTQTLLALEIDTYSEAFEDVESVTVANWERASSRGRPGYSRSIGGSTQHSSLEGGELPYDFFYRNRSLGVSQSDTGLESSVLEFSSGGRGGLTFELRRTYSSATVYTNEVRPEINTIVTPMLSSLVSDVDCGPNGDQPCPAVDAAIRNAESRMVDFLVKGAEDSCVRLRDRWVGMMKLGGQRGWFGDPIPDNVEDLDCKFQRVVRGIASEFRAGTIDFDTVLRRLSPSSPEVLSHNEVMPFWPKSDRAQGRETVYCHPGIPGFDAYQRCQGADPNTYVAELAPERDEKRVLVRARSIEFALPGPLGHGTNAQLAASLRGDSMTIGREQPILADVPCSVAMAEQKELYDDFRPRFECLGWKTPYATFASVAARIVPLYTDAGSAIPITFEPAGFASVCTTATTKLCDDKKRHDDWIQYAVAEDTGNSKILTRPLEYLDVFPWLENGAIRLPEEEQRGRSEHFTDVARRHVETLRQKWRERPDGKETETVSAARRISEAFRNGRKTPVHSGLHGGWSFNLPYLLLPGPRPSVEPVASDRLGELHFGDGVAEFSDDRAAVFPDIDGVLVKLDGDYVEMDEFVDPMSATACEGEAPEPEREPLDCLRASYGPYLADPTSYLFTRNKPVILGVLRDDVEYKLTVRDRLYFFDRYGRLRYITDPTLANSIVIEWRDPAPISVEAALADLTLSTVTDAANNTYYFEYRTGDEIEGLRDQALSSAGLPLDSDWLRSVPPVLKRIVGPEKTAEYEQVPVLPEGATSTANERWVLKSVHYEDDSGPPSQSGAADHAQVSYDYQMQPWFECWSYQGNKVDNCDLTSVVGSAGARETRLYAPLLTSETGPAGGTIKVFYKDPALQGEVPNSSGGSGCRPRADVDGKGALGIPYLPPAGFESARRLYISPTSLAGSFVCDYSPFYYVDSMPRVERVERVDISERASVDGIYLSTQSGRTRSYVVENGPPPSSVVHETPIGEAWNRSQWTYQFQEGRMGEVRVPRLVEHRVDASEFRERRLRYSYDTFGNVTRLAESYGRDDPPYITEFRYKEDSLEESVFGSASSVTQRFDTDVRVRYFDYLTYAPWIETKTWGDQVEVSRGFEQSATLNPGRALKPTSMRVGTNLGLEYRYRYDEFGNLVHEVTPSGGERNFNYASLNSLPAGQLSTITHSSAVDSEQVTKTLAFDSKLRLISVKDGRNRELSWSYDGFSRLVSHTDPENSFRFEYVRRQVGATTRKFTGTEFLGDATCDWHGRLGETTLTGVSLSGDVLSRTETYSYDALVRVNLRSFKDQEGNMHALEKRTYDQFGRVRSLINGLGAITEYAYDDRGGERLVGTTDPAGFTHSTSLNAFGEVSEDRFGTYGYTSAGQLDWSRDKVGTVTRYIRDSAERVTSVLTYSTNAWEPHNPPEFDYSSCSDVPNDTKCDQQSYVFEPGRWEPVSIVDGEGNEKALNYDGLGRLESTSDGEGVEERYSYDAAGSPAGWSRGVETRAFDYDFRGRVRQVDEGSLFSTRYTYDARGRLFEVTDLHASTSRRFAYDELGRIIGEEEEDGDRFETEYHPVYGMPTRRSDGRGRDFERHFRYHPGDVPSRGWYRVEESSVEGELLFTYDYDRLGRRLTQASPSGSRIWSRTFDSFGNVAQSSTYFDEPQTTVYHYDAMGRYAGSVSPELRAVRQYRDYRGRVDQQIRYRASSPQGEIDGDVARESWSYDRVGNLEYHINGLGALTRYDYDSANRLSSFHRFGEDPITVDYSSDESIVTSTRSNGEAQVETFGDAGQLVSSLDAGGFQESFAYTSWGALEEYRYGRFAEWSEAASTRYAYTEDRKLQSVTQPDGGVESFTYNAVGLLRTHTHLSGLVDTYTYDAPFDDVSSVANAANGTTRYTYDDRRRLELIVRASGSSARRTTKFVYGANQRQTLALSEPQDFSMTEFYDGDGFVTEMRTPDGESTTYDYNGRGELSSLTTPMGRVNRYIRNAVGQLLQHELDDVRVGPSYTYDGYGRVTREQRGEGAIDFQYDKFGRLSSRISSERAVYFDYYGDDRLKEIHWGTHASSQYTYDARNELSRVVTTGRPTVEFERDNMGRVLTDSVGGKFSPRRRTTPTVRLRLSTEARSFATRQPNSCRRFCWTEATRWTCCSTRTTS